MLAHADSEHKPTSSRVNMAMWIARSPGISQSHLKGLLSYKLEWQGVKRLSINAYFAVSLQLVLEPMMREEPSET